MPNKLSSGQRERRYVKTLERMRDYRAEFIRERRRGGGEQPQYTVAELTALNWALRKLGDAPAVGEDAE